MQIPTKLQQPLVIVAAAIAALIGYGLLVLIDVDLVLENGDEIGIPEVLAASLIGGALAWLVFELLRRSAHLRWWPFVGSTGLAISMLGPSYQADGSTAMALMSLHFAVAIVLIYGFAKVGASEAWCRDEASSSHRESAMRQR